MAPSPFPGPGARGEGYPSCGGHWSVGTAHSEGRHEAKHGTPQVRARLGLGSFTQGFPRPQPEAAPPALGRHEAEGKGSSFYQPWR